MEKLQIAIDHARKRRDAKLLRGAPGPKTSTDEAWAALQSFEPSIPHLRRNRLVTTRDKGAGRTAVDMLRTRLLTMLRENSWKRVMITSPTPSCGKSTVLANLALALQRQRGLRILAIDLDLHRPAMARLFGIKPTNGVGDLLRQEVPAKDHLWRIGHNLALSVSPKPDKAGSELIKSEETKALIDSLEAEYQPDITIFDVPPMFASDDTIAAARFVDCAVIVGAAEDSSVADFDTTERDLAQYTKIAGVVLNKCRFPGKQAGYDYDYY